MSLEATLATWELTKNEVNSREKFLLLSLARRTGEDHTCWPSLKRIVEDTGFDRKTVVDVRQSLIEKKLLKYTGRMVGRSSQIPEMELMYVDTWEQKRNSPRLQDSPPRTRKSIPVTPKPPVDNFVEKNVTSPKNGTGTSPKNGTGTSTENGTLNSKEEKVSRNKSFCAIAPEKPKSEKPKSKAHWKEENKQRPNWAEKKDMTAQSRQQMENEAKHIEQHEEIKRAPMPQELRDLIKNMRRARGRYDNTKDGGRLQTDVG